MKTMIRLTLLALLVLCPIAAAQEKKPTESPKADAISGKAVVEVFLSTEHSPAGLKAADKVILMRVNGKSVTRKGKVAYTCAVVVPEAMVVGVVNVEKPMEPEQAVKVKLQTTKEQAALVERVKVQFVDTYETTGDGRSEMKKTPVTLRLEFSKSDKKPARK